MKFYIRLTGANYYQMSIYNVKKNGLLIGSDIFEGGSHPQNLSLFFQVLFVFQNRLCHSFLITEPDANRGSALHVFTCRYKSCFES